jgi:ubiquinone/menaquinone biosynthesis C-methylase UbiE
MKKLNKAITTENLKVFWNEFEKEYSTHSEKKMIMIYSGLWELASKYKKQNILELACGTGEGLKYMVHDLISTDEIERNKINIHALDLSSNMLNSAYSKLTRYQSNLRPDIMNIKILSQQQDNIKNEHEKYKINLELMEGDNENLGNFKNEQMDVVIANYSLHLVEKPEKMLKECSRVLKKDGIALFSIWGRPENSLQFTLVPNILKKHNIELPDQRSWFHISKINNLRKLVLENGFKHFSYSYSYCPLNYISPHEFDYMINSPTYKKILDSLDLKKREEIKKEIYVEIDKLLYSGEMIGSEGILMACRL